MSYIPSIITSPDSAQSHEYLVLGRSLAGQYVNIGYTPPKSVISNRHDWYNVLTDHYINPVNDHFGQSNDTLDATLLIANTAKTNEAFKHILQRGAGFISQLPHNQTAIYTPDHAKRWAICANTTHFEEVTDVCQLTLDPTSVEYRIKYGKNYCASQLVTVWTQSRKHYIFTCSGYASLSRLESCINDWGMRHDPIVWVLLSHKDNAKHQAVVKELLSRQGQVCYGHLVSFINPTGNLHTRPAISNKQAGYIKLPLIFMLLIGILLLILSSCYLLGYTAILSKNISGQASRDTLAFFVPDNIAASQAVIMPSCTAPKAHLDASRGHSIISMANHLPTSYDGLTLQNKIAERRICGAVTNVTESKTRHPIPIIFNQSYSVAFTQKILGAIHHG